MRVIKTATVTTRLEDFHITDPNYTIRSYEMAKTTQKFAEKKCT
jgi:hypothetical protein